MPSNLFLKARKAWFDRTGLTFEIELGLIDVSYELMKLYGGPREISKCDECTGAEWATRLLGCNNFMDHKCLHPANYNHMKQQCANVIKPEWLHLRRNYNIALGCHKTLPGLKCLFVAGAPNLLVHHGPKTGLMLWRKRMSPYQTTFCGFNDVSRYDLSKFDFIIMTVHGQTPILPKGSPPVFLYCHDHHPPAIQKRAQELFNTHPTAVLTPYPSIWTRYFNIHSSTKVLFTPFLADPFWANASTSFDKRPYDVMLIGVGGSVYPERTAMANLLKSAKVPFKLKLWNTAAPKVGKEQIAATKYGAPPLLLWSRHLAKAKICVFGQDKFGYLVNKYSEIPSATSLMVAPDIPECKRIGLIPGNNFIALERPIQSKLIPQLTSLVANFKKYEPIARNGLKWLEDTCERMLYNDFWTAIEETLGVTNASAD